MFWPFRAILRGSALEGTLSTVAEDLTQVKKAKLSLCLTN
jgi:hypothetical protein